MPTTVPSVLGSTAMPSFGLGSTLGGYRAPAMSSYAPTTSYAPAMPAMSYGAPAMTSYAPTMSYGARPVSYGGYGGYGGVTSYGGYGSSVRYGAPTTYAAPAAP